MFVLSRGAYCSRERHFPFLSLLGAVGFPSAGLPSEYFVGMLAGLSKNIRVIRAPLVARCGLHNSASGKLSVKQ